MQRHAYNAYNQRGLMCWHNIWFKVSHKFKLCQNFLSPSSSEHNALWVHRLGRAYHGMGQPSIQPCYSMAQGADFQNSTFNFWILFVICSYKRLVIQAWLSIGRKRGIADTLTASNHENKEPSLRWLNTSYYSLKNINK